MDDNSSELFEVVQYVDQLKNEDVALRIEASKQLVRIAKVSLLKSCSLDWKN